MKGSRTLGFASGLVLAGVLAGCGKKQEAPPKPPPPEVGVVEMHPENAPLVRDLVGRLSAFRSADVRARVPGVLQKRTYREGSEVKEGDLMFKIDPAPLQASLNSSLGALAQAQASFANNHIAAQRARDLVPKGFVSKADVDNAEAAERTSDAAVKQAKANVESSRINLGYADVRAPISGRAGKQQVTEGALVGQGDATLLTTIDQIDPVYVNFTIGVNDLDDMRRAKAAGHATLAETDKAEIRLALSDGSEYGTPGTLDFSDTSVDPATGAVSLRGQIPNPDRSLLPGMYVSIKATLGERRGIFKVPQAALQRDATGPFVLTIGSDGKVARKNVTTDIARDGYWTITDGLATGDKVIASGIQRAKTGEPAKGVPWKPGDDAKAAANAKPDAGKAADPNAKPDPGAKPQAGNASAANAKSAAASDDAAKPGKQ